MIAETVWLEWVERLGGWGVLVFVVWWMMRRSDVRDTLMQAAFAKLSEAVDTFAEVERQNRADHKEILDTLSRCHKKIEAREKGDG